MSSSSRSLSAALALMIMAFTLQGCAASDTSDSVELQEVQSRLADLTKYEFENGNGTHRVSVDSASVAYLLVPKSQRSAIGSSNCTFGDIKFTPIDSTLNIPNDRGFDAFFAVVQAEVPESGDYDLKCDLDSSLELALLIGPQNGS